MSFVDRYGNADLNTINQFMKSCLSISQPSNIGLMQKVTKSLTNIGTDSSFYLPRLTSLPKSNEGARFIPNMYVLFYQ